MENTTYYLWALQNFVVDEPPLQGTNMQQSLTQRALDTILSQVNPCDSDGDDIDLQPDSDSDLSSDDETRPQPKRARLGSDLSQTATDGTAWREERVGARLPLTPTEAYAADGEPTAAAKRSVSSRLESFLRFITLDMLHSIQQCTVQHARRTDHDSWFVDIPELMAFISIILFRGVVKLPSLSDYWSATLGQPLVTGTMSRDRFQDIMRHLRFDDSSTRVERAKTDEFAAVSHVWRSFVSNCVSSYSPGAHVAVDALLFPTKTRCRFLQYVASKPERFGLKFWVACDAKSKYICNVLPCLGKDPSGPSADVVMRLMEPFLDTGRNVTTDSRFTSLSLAQRLRSRKTTILGAVDENHWEIPQSAKQTDRRPFTTQVFSTSGAALTAYARTRRTRVHVLSSMHSVVHAENAPKRKPNTVALYDSTRSGVDAMAQMLRNHSVRAATRRWPVAVFYVMIDMAALNAHALYEACTGRKEGRADFLAELATELANPHVGEKRARKEQLLRQQPPAPEPGKRAVCQVKHRCKENRTTRRCVGCYKYSCGRCIKQTPWLCHYCE
ncbi:uncharacterized protein LOC114844769 [Betta splendens]|uniref:Uncharacterized protein LOC114844769 n=1 Tax=Betta splendens TaxID=158456 RepID=A0A6P7L2M8_BETSP|nr:uncharacterized protein LOC114844769 [Betta splendens]